MQSVLITGANRGLGLEFSRQYLADGWQVFATCREPDAAEALQSLSGQADGRLSIHAMDVTQGESVRKAAQSLGDAPLDLIVNNAGVLGDRAAGIGSLNAASMQQTLQANVIGPLQVMHHFVPLLAADGARKIATVSSKMGSIELCSPGAMTYRTSKAAVNMLNRCAALELADQNITAIVLHPGWVQTDMGGANADFTPQTSVAAMRSVIAEVGLEDSGQFFNYNGARLPW